MAAPLVRAPCRTAFPLPICAASMASAMRPFTNGRPGLGAWTSARAASVAPLVRATMAARLKALEDENAKLKRLLADTMLDNVALKDLLGKKW